ncbi:hypothetical protein MMC34_002772 [Xylographa carneopallida]|nr:hypothetical protein [Xylographa carneopallida]
MAVQDNDDPLSLGVIREELDDEDGSEAATDMSSPGEKVSEPNHGADIIQTAASVAEENEQDGMGNSEKDLEAAHRTSSGPVYSVFGKREKQFIIFMAAWSGLFSSLSANIYFPALNVLSKDLKVSQELINLTLTSYMVFQGLAPTLYGDLADMAGRRPAYFIGFVIYIAANIGLATQDSYIALFLLRCLQSSGSSGTIALGNGVAADVTTHAERGITMGLVAAGPMIGPALGPVLGGILSQFLGWRSIFWFLTILAVVFFSTFLVSFPETGRNVVANGSVRPQDWNMSLLQYLRTRKTQPTQEEEIIRNELRASRKLRFPNPLKTISIIMEKDVAPILFYNAIVYTAFYDVTTSIPSLFAEIYGFSSLQIGLSFLPFGIGCLLASIITGKLMDFNYHRLAKSVNLHVDRKRGDNLRKHPIEKARIQVAEPLICLGSVTLLCYGWVLEKGAPLAAPLVLQFIIGFCLTGVFDILNTLLVDLYPESSATATAANNLVRCLLGAAGTAVILQMITGMGRGWCFTFIAAVVFFTSPLLWVVVKWGPKWREARRVRVRSQ